MAWEEKYKVLLRDRFNILGTAKIYEDGYSGAVTTLIGSGSTPLRFEFCNESDNVMDPFKSSRVVITVWSFSMFALADLCSAGNMYHKVEIFHGENLYWSGYIDPHQCTEQYGPVPYPVNIYCIDGLTLLKKIRFDNDGEYYNGRRMESQIILDILGKIGFTSFYESCNIYEDRMADSVDDSPFDQTFIDVDIFRDMYCYDVLVELLKKFNAIIRQSYGAFYITRPTEMIQNSVAGRFFSGATTKSSVTIMPDQFIYRPDTHPSRTIRQVDGGPVMYQSPAKKVIIKQDYGYKESWIDNWEFKGETYNDVTGTWDYWINVGAGLNSIADWITTETDGCILPTSATPYAYNIHQEFGTNAMISASDKFGFQFDWLTYSWHGSSINAVTISIQVKDNTNSKYLTRSGANFLDWVDTVDYVEFVVVIPDGISEWQTWSGLLSGLDVNGAYTITLYGSHAAGNEVDFITGFKNIKFFVNSEEMSAMESMRVLPYQREKFLGIFYSKMRQRTVYKTSKVRNTKGRDYITENDINGEELEYDCLLGDVTDANIDNVLEQFAGSLAGGTAQIRVDTITLSGNSGQCVLLCNEVGGFAVWDTSLTQTAANFVTNYAAGFLLNGIVLTSSGADVIFTASEIGFEFNGATRVTDRTGTLNGTVIYTSPAYALFPSESWRTRTGSESKELLQLKCDEIAEQYARSKQLIQMPIMDTAGQMAINLLGNIQDTVNTLDGKARVFVINRGEFDKRKRIWNLDLFEIGTKTIEAEPGEIVTIKYGLLYNWYAAMDVRNMAPIGYHLPSQSEYQDLYDQLGVGGGGMLKETGFVYWTTPNTGATNSTEFFGRGSGQRLSASGLFDYLNIFCDLWTETEHANPIYAYVAKLTYNNSDLAYNTTANKKYGLAIRFIKDDSDLGSGTVTGNDGKVYPTVKIGDQVWMACNSAETKYQNGDNIPEIKNNAEWIALTTGALCAYNNNWNNAYGIGYGIITADNMVVTVDSDVITVDSG